MAAAAISIVTAGCASAGATGPGSVDGAASVVPANAAAFVAASTDLTSSQWHAVTGIFLKGFEQQTKLSWNNDVRPALGGEVDVALLPGKQVVVLTQPHDAAKLAALATKYNVQTRTIGDWTAIAQSSDTLDTVANSKTHLAESNLFIAAMNRLPGDALVRVYANGAEAQQLISSIPGQMETAIAPVGARYRVSHRAGHRRAAAAIGTTEFQWIAAALTGSGNGLKLEAFARAGALTASAPPRYIVSTTAPYAPALVDEIPSGALAVLDFQVPSGTFELLPQLPPRLQKLFGPDAITLPNQLDTLLGGETALYVRPGVPIPEVTLVTQPPDTAAASQTLDELLAALPKTSMFSGLKLYRAVMGGQFVVSTTQRGIDDLRGGGPKLSSDPSFLEAKKQSGMPEQVTGFVYVNAKDVLPLLQLAGPKLPAGLPDLRTLAAFGGRSAGDSTFTVFLGVGSS